MDNSKVYFNLTKRINTRHNSIFYSVIHYKNQIFGFGRYHYSFGLEIIRVKLNNNLDIVEYREKLKGEDPRCFIHNNKLYIQDNYFNNMYLIDYEENTYRRVPAQGKNISYISHKNKLYFIHYIKPFVLYEHDLDTNTIAPVQTIQGDQDYEYRGGTPGYKFSESEECTIYYGFGHRTYNKNSVLTHDVFLWVLYFNGGLPFLKIHEVIQPPNSKNICDPTCVIKMDDKYYMITAESEHGWWVEQDYVTNLYEIKNLENYMSDAK